MKTAILIKDGRTQIVLTAEGDHDRAVLGLLKNRSAHLSIHSGGAYDCRGGWTKINDYDSDDSLIIVLDKRPPECS